MKKRIDDIEEGVKEIAKYVRNEVIRLEELLEKKAPDREYLERVEKAKEEIDSNLRILQLLKQDIETMKSETENVENKIIKLEEKFSSGHEEASTGNIERRVDFLEREMKESIPTRKRLEEEAVLRMSIEKRLEELEKRSEDLETRKGIKEPSKSEAALKFRLEELEKRLRDIEAIRYKAGKPVPVSDVPNIERRLTRLESSEFPAIDKKLELKVSRYLSEQLENFAKALDKKLPNAALIEDYTEKLSDVERRMNGLESAIKADVDKRLVDLNQGMRSVEEKIKTVESPDLSPLANRVALLEKRMVEILAMMKSFSSRMPVVVE